MKATSKNQSSPKMKKGNATVFPEITDEARDILDAAKRAGNVRLLRPVYELPILRYETAEV